MVDPQGIKGGLIEHPEEKQQALVSLIDAKHPKSAHPGARQGFPIGDRHGQASGLRRLFTAGAVADCCYIIDRGQVRIELDQPEWYGDSVLGYVDSGSIVGEVSILDGLPRSAGAYAETPVEARRIAIKDLDELAISAPSAYAAVIGARGRDVAELAVQPVL